MATPSTVPPGGRVAARLVREVDLNTERHDIPAMLAADPRAGMLYVCNPSNPTGTMMTPTDAIRQALADKPKGGVLVVDEAYIDFSTPQLRELGQEHNDTLVLRTFSKIYGMAGARVGLAMCPGAAGAPRGVRRRQRTGRHRLARRARQPGRRQAVAATQGAQCSTA